MATFTQTDYIDFKTNNNILNGVIGDEVTLNKSPNKLKKEVNNLYNENQLNSGLLCIAWRSTEPYEIGDLVSRLGVNYRAKLANSNITPAVGSYWELAVKKTFTLTGDVSGSVVNDASGNATITTVADATSSNMGNKLVKRDANGDFSARNITGTLLGNANTATTLTDLTASVTELNYTDGVTSSIQNQLNDKLSKSTTSQQTINSNITVGVGAVSSAEGGQIDFAAATGSGKGNYSIDVYSQGLNNQYFRMIQTLTDGGTAILSFPQVNGIVWTSGNDGEGSQLDAGLLAGLLPKESGTPNTIVKRGSTGSTVLSQLYLGDGDGIKLNSTNGSIVNASGNTLSLGNGFTNVNIKGSTAWYNGNCLSNLAGRGYQKLGSGMILQWGDTISSGTSDNNATISGSLLPLVFPNACLFASAVIQGPTSGNYTVQLGSMNLNSIGFTTYLNGSVANGVGIRWVAIGY